MTRSIIQISSAVLLVTTFVFGGRTERPLSDLGHPGQSIDRFAYDDQKVKPLPPIRYVRSRNFDTKHIALDLKFDWDKEQTFGIEHFTFSPLTPNFQVLNLDAGNMIFRSVELSNGTELEYSYDRDNTSLLIRLDRGYAVGEIITVVIKYQTTGETVSNTLGFGGGGGLKFVKPNEDAPDKPWQIWSQGESEYNRYWFPSFDYPNDFRTTELKATVKKPLMVVSNGALIEIRDNGDDTRTYHWKMDTPYTNYLTSIVVGEFTEVRGDFKGKPVSTYVYKNWKREGEITARRLPAMVKFFSEKLNFDYPYSKYAQTIGHEFNGGMENITATTQTDQMILDERTELDGDQDGLQAHELAHQWFGDYVTCRDWSEIWLNESFATYLESLWQGESKGKDYFLFNEVKANQDGYFGAWNQGNRHPIVTKYYANPDSVFDSYAYARGGAVLHMLRKQLGDEDFFRALNHYLKSNANQPVETEDFRIAIEEATGRSMDAFFYQWLYQMGHPVFDVRQNYDPATGFLTLTVNQTQKRDITSLYPQAVYFQTPVDIEIVTSKGTEIRNVQIEPKEENVFQFDVQGKPLMIDFDNEGTLIKELIFEKPVQDLVYQAKNDKDILGRNWALSELTRMAAEKEVSKELRSQVITILLDVVSNESAWQLRQAGISRIRSIVYAGRNAPQNTKPASSVLNVEIVEVLKKAATDRDSRVRSEAISLLGTTGDKKFYPIYSAAVMSDKSYDVIDAAAEAIAMTGEAGAYAVLRKVAQTDSWRERVSAAGLKGLAILGDARALDLGFKYAGNKGSPPGIRNAALKIIGNAGKNDPRAFPLIFANFKESLDSNAFQSIFSGLEAIISLSDPRGQEAFELVKAKFKDSAQLMGYIAMFEARFKKALEENNDR